MESAVTICPVCHVQVRETDYFCANCGKSLRAKPTKVSALTMILYTIASIVLPPMGILWGIRYLREEDKQTKLFGMILIILTIVVLVIITIATINIIQTVNNQVNQQLQLMGGF